MAKGRMMVASSLLICFGLANGIAALALTGDPYHHTKESCDLGVSGTECQLRMAQCGVVNSILQAEGGPVNSVMECAEAVGVSIHPAIFANLGTAYLTGKPPSILDQVQVDPTSIAALRYCTMNATGLVMENGKIDRMELSERFETQLYYVPNVSSVLIQAATVCPEPEDYKLEEFVACIRAFCLKAQFPLPFSAEDLNLVPRKPLLLSALPTTVPINSGFWMM